MDGRETRPPGRHRSASPPSAHCQHRRHQTTPAKSPLTPTAMSPASAAPASALQQAPTASTSPRPPLLPGAAGAAAAALTYAGREVLERLLYFLAIRLHLLGRDVRRRRDVLHVRSHVDDHVHRVGAEPPVRGSRLAIRAQN